MITVFWVLSAVFFIVGVFSWGFIAVTLLNPDVELGPTSIYYLTAGVLFMTPLIYLVMFND